MIQPAPVGCQLLDDTQHAWRQGIGACRKDGGQFHAQEADTLAHGDPAFQHEGANLVGDAGALRHQPLPPPLPTRKARMWWVMPVRCAPSRSRTRCSACRSSCSAVLVATNFIVGRCTASAIASASLKSFFFSLLLWP